MEYFSERERGPKPRLEEKINPKVWGGIVAYIQSLISTGAFGYKFPVLCPNKPITIGTDLNIFSLALQSEVPGIMWPLRTNLMEMDPISLNKKDFAPETLSILDLIEFCYRNSAKPIQEDFDYFYGHHHLTFDVQEGNKEFCDKINTLFSRNGLAYELTQDGTIVRLGDPILQKNLANTFFQTGDDTLDQMLEEARSKFTNPNISIRYESVERLWDAWERIKTIECPDNKKHSIQSLLGKASLEPKFRQLLEDEAKKLTEIGNSFQIRHSEITQTKILESEHLDYIFYRLFSLIQLLLKKQ